MTNTAELLRLIHNLIRLGTIAEVDHSAARVRIRSGELLSDWRPWISLRAGTTRDWDPPTVGEQAVLFSPGGDPAAGIALVGLYCDAHPAPASSPNLWKRVMPDGAVLEYDHAAHHLQATLPGTAALNAQGNVTLTTAAALTATAQGGATINADTVINGNVAFNGGSVTHNGKNIGDTHQHSGITSGPSNTGVPV